MMRARALRKMILLVLLFTMAMIPVRVMSADSVMLVTADEAAQPDVGADVTADKAAPPDVRVHFEELNEGPTIDIKSPENGATLTGPFRLYVEVIKRPGGSDINMGSLTVTYLKVVNIDITNRVRKYISGTKLDIPNAELPAGHHQALISIKDVSGKVSGELFSVTVTKP